MTVTTTSPDHAASRRNSLTVLLLALSTIAISATGCGPEGVPDQTPPEGPTELGTIEAELNRSCTRCTSLSCSVDSYHYVTSSLTGTWNGSVFTMTGYWIKYVRTGGFTQNNANNEY